jgi:hypothetical protein
MFFGRVIDIGDPVLVIGTIDELDFGMGFPVGDCPVRKGHNITSLIRYSICYHPLFHNSIYYNTLSEKS